MGSPGRGGEGGGGSSFVSQNHSLWPWLDFPLLQRWLPINATIPKRDERTESLLRSPPPWGRALQRLRASQLVFGRRVSLRYSPLLPQHCDPPDPIQSIQTPFSRVSTGGEGLPLSQLLSVPSWSPELTCTTSPRQSKSPTKQNSRKKRRSV